VERDVIYQVLDIPLSYNILLGRPWIHAMQEVPSMYHWCLKFPHNGVEVSIPIDINISCNTLQQSANTLVPHNRVMSVNGNSKASANNRPSDTPTKIIYDGIFIQLSASLANEIEEAVVL